MYKVECPYCKSDNYNFMEVDDFNSTSCSLKFKCLGSCGKEFYIDYTFDNYSDFDGNIIEVE